MQPEKQLVLILIGVGLSLLGLYFLRQARKIQQKIKISRAHKKTLASADGHLTTAELQFYVDSAYPLEKTELSVLSKMLGCLTLAGYCHISVFGDPHRLISLFLFFMACLLALLAILFPIKKKLAERLIRMRENRH